MLTTKKGLCIINNAFRIQMPSNCIRNYEFGVWRSTQEAEEVPLLRV